MSGAWNSLVTHTSPISILSKAFVAVINRKKKIQWRMVHFTTGRMFCLSWCAPSVSCWSQHRMVFTVRRCDYTPMCSRSEFHAHCTFLGKVKWEDIYGRDGCVIQHYTSTDTQLQVVAPPTVVVWDHQRGWTTQWRTQRVSWRRSGGLVLSDLTFSCKGHKA